jgi:hypothetical protein
VHGMCALMFLTQVAMLLKADFLGNPGQKIGTRAFIPFLALIGRLLRFLVRIQFALLIGADAFDCFQRSQKQAHVHRHHAILVQVILVLSLDRAHTQHMSP